MKRRTIEGGGGVQQAKLRPSLDQKQKVRTPKCEHFRGIGVLGKKDLRGFAKQNPTLNKDHNNILRW